MTSRSLGHRAPLLWLVLPLMAGLATGKLLPTWETLPPREARLGLQIDRVFTQSDARRASGLATVMRADDHLRELVGQRLYFSLALKKGEAAPVRSAVVATVGVLETIPKNPPSDTFDGYLAGAGMNFRLKRGQVLAEERPATAYYRFCARAAARFKAILALGIAERWPALSGLLCAMMLGETHELSNEQHALFMQSGTMHLFAISGLNIGVIAGALQLILVLLRLPGWARFVVGAALLWLFVDITGASPSAVRAFVMAVFLHAAFVLRRPANPLAALVASALVVLLIAPLQLFSASFLMSYAIVAALLVLGLPLGDAWLERWKPWRDLPPATWSWWQRLTAKAWHGTATALAIGVATTLVGLLTGVQFFRLLTPGALVANLVLIPAAMLATFVGFASLLLGLAGWTWGAAMANTVAGFVLWGIEQLVRLSVRLPGAFVPAQFRADWVGPVALAVLIAGLIAGYANDWKPARGGWWPP
ncbi:MAG: ComEC/Rec2 family competence protein, partial [Verrucomicrobia bacterium]|nr:ComEC/Rec2 family competence protein [Verrucomicrobiota bacterium]